MSIAGKITDFIKTCPFLQDFESMFQRWILTIWKRMQRRIVLKALQQTYFKALLHQRRYPWQYVFSLYLENEKG